MRKILFRGKRIDNGEWVEGYLTRRPSAIQYGAHYSPWFIDKPPSDPDDSADFCNVDGETVGQFTGLSDRNGKRIFEGDIVYLQGIRFIVEFKGAEWIFSHIKGQPFAYPFFAAHAKFCEILGNAHDNPDLLTKQKEET